LSRATLLSLCQGQVMVIARFFVYLIGMTIDQFMCAIETAWAHALAGHEAADRDELHRALRRLLDHEPRPSAPIRVRLMLRD
jgi:hypothetical protein